MENHPNAWIGMIELNVHVKKDIADVREVIIIDAFAYQYASDIRRIGLFLIAL